MAAAALAVPLLSRKEREEQMREFFRKLEQSERERWILLIETRVMQAK